MKQETTAVGATVRERVFGCLLGGAVGDALGAPVEFWSRARILAKFPPNGVDDYFEFDRLNGKDSTETGAKFGAITDDTQMTLFTAEGLIDALEAVAAAGGSDGSTKLDDLDKLDKLNGSGAKPAFPRGFDAEAVERIAKAYARWYDTQSRPILPKEARTGELIDRPELRIPRAPGGTCMSALSRFARTGEFGSPSNRINDSKGCGTVMRVAPIGLVGFGTARTFAIGRDSSATTHCNPTGYLPGGAAAVVVERLFGGADVASSVETAIEALEANAAPDESRETVDALRAALDLAASDARDADAIKRLGEGWTAEEALAISVFCAARYPNDFRGGVLAAVNIDGDADSTGTITGNLLGAKLGVGAIPRGWVERLRERAVVERTAERLLAAVGATR